MEKKRDGKTYVGHFQPYVYLVSLTYMLLESQKDRKEKMWQM